MFRQAACRIRRKIISQQQVQAHRHQETGKLINSVLPAMALENVIIVIRLVWIIVMEGIWIAVHAGEPADPIIKFVPVAMVPEK